MKFNKLYIIIALLPFLFSSCDDFLNVKDNSAISSTIWDNEESAKLYLNNIYSSCLPAFGGESLTTTSLANLSDETSDMSSDILLGSLGSSKITVYSATTYESIRYVNIGLDALKKSALTGEARKRTAGQLYFFRAWQHWKLVNLYGGVPYMKDYVTFTSDSSLINAPRNKTSECIEYLKQDLDSAIALLPTAWVSTEYARITRAAAAAFKGRVLLFWASPQFNPTNDINRWREAYEANLSARDLCLQDGYGLMSVTSAVTNTWPYGYDFNQIFRKKKSDGNNEVLIATPYYTDLKTHGYENSVCPAEVTSGSSAPSLCPSWDLVLSFPMKDGSLAFKINPSYSSSKGFPYIFTGNNGDMKKFYLNRDPRFYATVAFNGCYYQLEGNSSRRQWFFQFTRRNGKIYYSENTTIDKISSTGFYCRKMVDPTLLRANMGKSGTDWIEMRYAEVLLNLAECAFEYQGSNSEIGYDCLKQIRARAGIDAGSDGYYGLKSNSTITPIELVMNERRVELAFEGKRFYDLRRRNMFTNNLGSYIMKLNGWRKSGSAYVFGLNNVATDSTMFLNSSSRDTIKLENLYKYFSMTAKSVGAFAKSITYVAITDPTTLQSTNTGNYNFFDIPQDILTRSSALTQTIGWQNGTFNPFD
jgi:starch-binding outer membrane protein, SusD/RagB family